MNRAKEILDMTEDASRAKLESVLGKYGFKVDLQWEGSLHFKGKELPAKGVQEIAKMPQLDSIVSIARENAVIIRFNLEK